MAAEASNRKRVSGRLRPLQVGTACFNQDSLLWPDIVFTRSSSANDTKTGSNPLKADRGSLEGAQLNLLPGSEENRTGYKAQFTIRALQLQFLPFADL